MVRILGFPADLGSPYYNLQYRSPSGGEAAWMLEVTYENEIKYVQENSEPLALVSVEASQHWAEIVLRAVKSGAAEYYIVASGEIHYGYPGPAVWGSGSSEILQITIE